MFKFGGSSEEKDSIVGVLYGIDGSEFVVSRLDMPYGKAVEKLKRKAAVGTKEKFTITSAYSTVEPFDIVEIPLDLTKSSMVTNSALLEYIQYSSACRRLIETSKLSISLINEILNRTREFNWDYHSLEKTIAKNQNVFEDSGLVLKLSFDAKLNLFTVNLHRTKELMIRYKSTYLAVIDKLLTGVVSGNSIYDSDVLTRPSELCNAIIKNNSEFFDGALVIGDIRDSQVEVLSKIIEKHKRTNEAIEQVKDCVDFSFFTGTNAQKYELAILFRERMLESKYEDVELSEARLSSLKTFPY